MNHPFIPANQYPRDMLLAFVGSKQRQSGIIWGPDQPGVVVCTSGGRHCASAGYGDCVKSDGTWLYFGQGESGAQDPTSKANRLLVDGERSILFFKSKEPTASQVKESNSYKKRYEFIGEFCCAGWDRFKPKNGNRKGDDLLIFRFVPTNDFAAKPTGDLAVAGLPSDSIQMLRGKLAALAAGAVKAGQSLQTYFLRSRMLKQYAKKRADGKCEYCQLIAPFSTTAGEPYLEIHHLLRLADDGPDAPENVACLCPNCHRRAHHGADRVHMQTELAMLVKKKEQSEPMSFGARLNMTDAYSR